MKKPAGIVGMYRPHTGRGDSNVSRYRVGLPIDVDVQLAMPVVSEAAAMVDAFCVGRGDTDWAVPDQKSRQS